MTPLTFVLFCFLAFGIVMTIGRTVHLFRAVQAEHRRALGHATKRTQRPDYAKISELEQEIFGETYEHVGAPSPRTVLRREPTFSSPRPEAVLTQNQIRSLRDRPPYDRGGWMPSGMVLTPKDDRSARRIAELGWEEIWRQTRDAGIGAADAYRLWRQVQDSVTGETAEIRTWGEAKPIRRTSLTYDPATYVPRVISADRVRPGMRIRVSRLSYTYQAGTVEDVVEWSTGWYAFFARGRSEADRGAVPLEYPSVVTVLADRCTHAWSGKICILCHAKKPRGSW